jgi:hypothetical protein
VRESEGERESQKEKERERERERRRERKRGRGREREIEREEERERKRAREREIFSRCVPSFFLLLPPLPLLPIPSSHSCSLLHCDRCCCCVHFTGQLARVNEASFLEGNIAPGINWGIIGGLGSS